MSFFKTECEQRLMALPLNYRQYVQCGFHSLELAERIQNILKLAIVDRRKLLMPVPMPWPKNTVQRENYGDVETYLKAVSLQYDIENNMPFFTSARTAIVFSDNGILALCEGLITLKQAWELSEYYLQCLLSNNGLILLREKLICPDPTKCSSNDLHDLLSNNGLKALRDKLISFEQAIEINRHGALAYLFSNNGIRALEEGLITIPQAFLFINAPLKLKSLLSNHGLEALREKLITPEQMYRLTSSTKHLSLTSELDLIALSELDHILSDHGVEKLQELKETITIKNMTIFNKSKGLSEGDSNSAHQIGF